MNYGKEFTKGILKENPTLVGLLGMCPTLAVTTAAFNGIGMGLSTMFVLICSNIVISLLRKVIPEQVKLPCYIVIIASFVTVIQFLVHGFVPALYTSLGAFLELITVNCIILGRAEMFASKNNVLASALDGAGMGLGFTLALFLMGSVREILGSGTWFGLTIPGMVGHTMSLFVMPAGGFLVLGFVTYIYYSAERTQTALHRTFSALLAAVAVLLGRENRILIAAALAASIIVNAIAVALSRMQREA